MRHSLPLSGRWMCIIMFHSIWPWPCPYGKVLTEIDEHASSLVVVMSGQHHINHSDVGCQISSLSLSSFVFPTDEALLFHPNAPLPPTIMPQHTWPPSNYPPSHPRENEVCGFWSVGWAKNLCIIRLYAVGMCWSVNETWKESREQLFFVYLLSFLVLPLYSRLWHHLRQSVRLAEQLSLNIDHVSALPAAVRLNWLAFECRNGAGEATKVTIKWRQREEQNRLIKSINVKAWLRPPSAINLSASLLLFIMCSHTRHSSEQFGRALSPIPTSLHQSLLSV